MKKCLYFLFLLGMAFPLAAQEGIVERVWVATDKAIYLAGERVHCSAFCVDAAGGFSTLSRVAYLELHSADGLVVTSKLALDGGRGGGYFDLPASLPTGNYRLIAYTAQNRNEVGYDFSGPASRTLSVFNTQTTGRVKDGVAVVSREEYDSLRFLVKPGITQNGGLSVSIEDGTLTMTNETATDMTLYLSVYRDDGILLPFSPDLAAFLKEIRQTGSQRFENRVLPDYEGEVLQARITGLTPQELQAVVGKSMFLSTPSDQAEVHVAPITGNGQTTFLTGNIYGPREMICQVEGAMLPAGACIEFLSPFVNTPVEAPETLRLTESIAPALEMRAAQLKAERPQMDTLSDYLPRKEYFLLDDAPVVYPLDDYTRFNSLEETFIEFIPQVRVRQDRNGMSLVQVRLEDVVENPFFSNDPALLLLDGVPILDHAKMLRYDPRLVKTIEVYPRTHYLGGRAWPGVVQFFTQKRNLTSFKLDDGVQVVDFQGISWPTIWMGDNFWHPLVDLGPFLTRQFTGILPTAPGRYIIHIGGMTTDAQHSVSATILTEIPIRTGSTGQ